MTDPEIFAVAQFNGVRFDGGRLDLESIQELVAYKRVIVDTAKWLFLEDNPDRARVPKGFERSFSLALTQVEDGSARAELLRVEDPEQLAFSGHGHDDYFELARTRINKVIEDASNGTELKEVPIPLLQILVQLGTTLGPEESLEFMRRGADNGPRYDRRVRRKISLEITEQYEEQLEEFGVIVGVDLERGTFSARLAGGRRWEGTFRTEDRDNLTQALDKKGYCRLQATVTYKQGGVQTRLELEDIEPLTLDGPDFESRLTELATLKNGWLDGSGLKPVAAKIAVMRDLLRLMVWDFGFIAPHLYPTESGFIRAEWTAEQWEVSLEIGLDAIHVGHALNDETDDEEILMENPTIKDTIQFIGQFVGHDPVFEQVFGDG